MLFDRWLVEALAGLDRPEHRQVLERFASWHIPAAATSVRRTWSGH
jgi:hypothetical protein